MQTALLICGFFLIALGCSKSEAVKIFPVKGVVKEVDPSGKQVVIDHEAITNYMDAMTMPFTVRNTNELRAVSTGDVVRFQLHVTDSESWITNLSRTGEKVAKATAQSPQQAVVTNRPPEPHPLKAFRFTNELGKTVSLNDFRGKALAITFIFTRCPIPDYCPRLTKNFEEASQKLLAMPNAPTNWHLLCVTIDPEFDSPAVLRSYGKRYNYDPKYWSFITGPKEKIQELASLSGVTYEFVPGTINHSFRTLIINTEGELQMSFPVSGNLSDGIVEELLKATKLVAQ